MTDDKYITIDHEKDNKLGDINISPSVLEIILGIAASKVSGVQAMRGTLSNSISELFGRKNDGRGVHVAIDPESEKLYANVYVYLEYGVSIPETSIKIQKALSEQLKFMTDLKLSEVNVHVVGLVTPKTDDTKVTADEESED